MYSFESKFETIDDDTLQMLTDEVSNTLQTIEEECSTQDEQSCEN